MTTQSNDIQQLTGVSEDELNLEVSRLELPKGNRVSNRDSLLSEVSSNTYDFSKRDYSIENLSGLSLAKLNFEASKFYNTDLSNCKFVNCDFSSADFSRANLTGTTFVGCIVDYANFETANLENTEFRFCRIKDTVFGEIMKKVEAPDFYPAKIVFSKGKYIRE